RDSVTPLQAALLQSRSQSRRERVQLAESQSPVEVMQGGRMDTATRRCEEHLRRTAKFGRNVGWNPGRVEGEPGPGRSVVHPILHRASLRVHQSGFSTALTARTRRNPKRSTGL